MTVISVCSRCNMMKFTPLMQKLLLVMMTQQVGAVLFLPPCYLTQLREMKREGEKKTQERVRFLTAEITVFSFHESLYTFHTLSTRKVGSPYKGT